VWCVLSVIVEGSTMKRSWCCASGGKNQHMKVTLWDIMLYCVVGVSVSEEYAASVFRVIE
jgi:hypothetical protein